MESLENFISNLISHLNEPNDNRLFEISQLLQSGTSALPLTVLKESKHLVLEIAEKAPDKFLMTGIFFYAKFIQSIEVENLVAECALIPQCLKIIRILKKINSETNLAEVNFEPFLKKIIDSIIKIILSYEYIQKTYEFLNILKIIERDFAIPISGQKKFNVIDFGIKLYIEEESDLIKSYTVLKKIKEEWKLDLANSEKAWIEKAWNMLEELNKEDYDNKYVKEILVLLNLYGNEIYPEINDVVTRFCEDFAVDLNEISNSELPIPENLEIPHDPSAFTSEFTPIFENHTIRHRSQFTLTLHPIMKLQNNITVWMGYTLLTQKLICAKEYKGNTQDLYENDIITSQNITNIGSPLYLKQFGNFSDGNCSYIVMEWRKNDLKDLKDYREVLSTSDLAYFMYSFIKGLSELTYGHIYHQDIKPETVGITDDNEFKLISFNNPTVENSDYSSPEKLKGLASGNEQGYSQELNDVYSLGLVILEAHTFWPIVDLRGNEEKFYDKVDEQISQIDIPWLTKILERMLTNNWNNRPKFRELLEMIENDEEFMNNVKEYRNKKKVSV